MNGPPHGQPHIAILLLLVVICVAVAALARSSGDPARGSWSTSRTCGTRDNVFDCLQEAVERR